MDLKTQKSHLLIPRFDSDHVVWGGEPLNVETAKNTYGFDSVWYCKLMIIILRNKLDF